MKESNALILRREDLIAAEADTDIRFIEFTMFREDLRPIYEHDIVLFIDDTGATALLKNRYGQNGLVTASK